MPVGKIVDGDRLGGMVFRKTMIEDGRVVPVPDSDQEFRAPLVVSSIGSLPQIIDGIPVDGQVFKIPDSHTGRFLQPTEDDHSMHRWQAISQ